MLTLVYGPVVIADERAEVDASAAADTAVARSARARSRLADSATLRGP